MSHKTNPENGQESSTSHRLLKRTARNVTEVKKTASETSRSIHEIFISHETPKQTLWQPHPLDNPDIQLNKTPYGRGVFATKFIPAGTVIAQFEGGIYRANLISELPNDAPMNLRDHVVQVGEDEFLHGKDGLAELINHSCDPNCHIEHLRTIVTNRDIKSGEQIVWDYATTEDSDWYHRGCLCGSPQCRGTIGPFKELPSQVAQDYIKRGMVSEWLMRKYGHVHDSKIDKKMATWKLRVKTLQSVDIKPECVQEVTDLFLYGFANQFAGQFLFYPSQGKPISAQEAFDVPKDIFVPVETLKKFDPKTQFPPHPQTGEHAVNWIDPKTTFEAFKKKLAKDATLTLMYDTHNNPIGFTVGNLTTVADQFKSEEWQNPHRYSFLQEPTKHWRDFKVFLDMINRAIAVNADRFASVVPNLTLKPESQVYCWNCVQIAPEWQDYGCFWRLTSHFFSAIPRKIQKSKLVIAETVVGTVAHKLFMRADAIEVPGILQPHTGELKEGDLTIILARLDRYAQTFTKLDKIR